MNLLFHQTKTWRDSTNLCKNLVRNTHIHIRKLSHNSGWYTIINVKILKKKGIGLFDTYLIFFGCIMTGVVVYMKLFGLPSL